MLGEAAIDGGSNVGRVYASLRAEILSCRLGPGSKLHIAALAEQLGVSPGAVREALTALVTERLVEARAQRGFRVAPISIEDLVDLTELRAEVENIAVRKAIALGDVQWEGEVIAAAHALERTEQYGGGDARALNPAWSRLHQRFHLAIVSACGSPRLLQLHNALYEQSERYRGLSQALISTGRSVGDEHGAIVAAILERDADRAAELLMEHLRTTTRIIVGAYERGEMPMLETPLNGAGAASA